MLVCWRESSSASTLYVKSCFPNRYIDSVCQDIEYTVTMLCAVSEWVHTIWKEKANVNRKRWHRVGIMLAQVSGWIKLLLTMIFQYIWLCCFCCHFGYVCICHFIGFWTSSQSTAAKNTCTKMLMNVNYLYYLIWHLQYATPTLPEIKPAVFIFHFNQLFCA